jgi:hypothetical protein
LCHRKEWFNLTRDILSTLLKTHSVFFPVNAVCMEILYVQWYTAPT